MRSKIGCQYPDGSCTRVMRSAGKARGKGRSRSIVDDEQRGRVPQTPGACREHGHPARPVIARMRDPSDRAREREFLIRDLLRNDRAYTR